MELSLGHFFPWLACIYSFAPAWSIFSLISASDISLLTLLFHHRVCKTDLGWRWIYLALIPLIHTTYRHSQPISNSWLALLGWFVCTLSIQFLAALRQPDNSVTSDCLSSKIAGLACFFTMSSLECQFCVQHYWMLRLVGGGGFVFLSPRWLMRYLCSSNTPNVYIFSMSCYNILSEAHDI